MLVVTGIGAALAGGTMAVIGGARPSDVDATLLAAGAITAGAGVVMLVAGIVLVATSETSVRLGDGTPIEYVSQRPTVRWAGDRLVF